MLKRRAAVLLALRAGLAACDDASEAAGIAIIGSGPGAHTAAIYSSRAGVETTLFEGDLANGVAAGGQLTTTNWVENFPGHEKGISGMELTEIFAKQSVRFGTRIHTETITKVDISHGSPFKLWFKGLADQSVPLLASALIIATGASPKTLKVPGESEYWQKGLSTCAVCDGFAFSNSPVAIVGGGDSAAEQALYMSNLASTVYLIHRRDRLRASRSMAQRVLNTANIVPIWNTQVTAILGDGSHVTALALDDADGTGGAGAAQGSVTLNAFGHGIDTPATVSGHRELAVSGVFVSIGHVPATAFLDGQLALDEDGYIITQPNMSTSVEGVWAAGDVQDRKYRQAITAAGSGCIAALEAERWLAVKGLIHH